MNSVTNSKWYESYALAVRRSQPKLQHPDVEQIHFGNVGGSLVVYCCPVMASSQKELFFYSTELHLREYHHLTWYRIVKEWTHEETRLFPSVLLSLRSSFHLVSISSERTFDMGIPWNLFTWVILIQDVSAAHDTQIFTVIPEVSLLLKCTHYWTCSSTI